MEPRYSVLVYSKFSPSCKRLLDRIQNSKINFETICKLQALCIDHPNIRERIKQSTSINLTVVPSILVIYPNGGVESFEAHYAFNWIDNIIKQFTPKPIQKPVYIEPIEKQRKQQIENFQETEKRKMQEMITRQKERERLNAKQENTNIEDIPYERSTERSYESSPYKEEEHENIPKRMTRIENIEHEPSYQEEENIAARHRSIPKPKRIRDGENSYIEDEAFFQGDIVDQKEPSNTVRSSAQNKTIQDPKGTMARMRELMAEADQIEKEIAPDSKRPNMAPSNRP